MDLQLPDLVRQRALAHGSAGQSWLDELPDVVVSLSQRWQLTPGAVLTGGTAGCVIEATDSNGSACVVKIAMALDADDVAAFERSVVVHQLADGQGCVRLIDHDQDASAMLLERLGPNLADLDFSVPAILDTVSTTLQAFWRPAPDDDRIPTGADKAAWLANYVVSTWEGLQRPCEREVIDQAVAYCDERAAAYTPDGAVLVHGDAHGWNTLAAPDGAFRFVDPEGLRSERAHDLAVPMREYNEPLLAGDTAHLVRQRAQLLAQACGIDPEPVWQWGHIERVSTGLANLSNFNDNNKSAGHLYLQVATRCR
jgi:streptomycin 6-kinase